MKRFLRLLFLLPLLAASCSVREDAAPDETLRVGVAVPPQAGLLQAMAPEGRTLAVTTLIDGAQNPHAFEPGARQLAELSKCAVYFSAGLPFEAPLIPRLQSLNPAMRIVALAEAHEEHEEHEGEEHGHDDPHGWTSPSGMLEMAAAMAQALQTSDPAHAAEWGQCHTALAKRLRGEADALRRRFAPAKGRAFLVYHPAWGRFAEECGLRQLAVEHHGGAPTAKHLAELSGAVKEAGIRAILVQSDSEAERAKPFAKSLGLAVVRANPLEPDPFRFLEATAAAVEQSLPVIPSAESPLP